MEGRQIPSIGDQLVLEHHSHKPTKLEHEGLEEIRIALHGERRKTKRNTMDWDGKTDNKGHQSRVQKSQHSYLQLVKVTSVHMSVHSKESSEDIPDTAVKPISIRRV